MAGPHALAQNLAHYLELMDRVIEQTQRRVFHGGTDLHSGFKPGKVDPSPPLACDREIFRQAETDAPIGRAVVKLLISAEVQKAHSIAH